MKSGGKILIIFNLVYLHAIAPVLSMLLFTKQFCYFLFKGAATISCKTHIFH